MNAWEKDAPTCPKMPKGERKSYSKKFKLGAVYLLMSKASPPPEKPLVFSSAGNLSISSAAGKPFDFLCNRKTFYSLCSRTPLSFSPRWNPFDFLSPLEPLWLSPHRGIMAEIEYPGVAQLVGRHIWDVEAARSSRATRTKKPSRSYASEGFLCFMRRNKWNATLCISSCFIFPCFNL